MKSLLKKRGTGLLVAVTVAALALTACSSDGNGNEGAGSPSDGPSTDEPIKVVIQTSESGALASLALDHVYGVRAGIDLATDGTNEIDGRPIEIVVADDGSDAGAVPAQIRGLIQQERPDFVFGTLSSAGAMASAPILADAKVPTIYTISATNGLTGLSEYIFRTSRNAFQEAQMGATVADPKPGQSFLVLAPDYEYGQSAAASWQDLLIEKGAEPISDPIFAPLDARDYTAVAERIRNANPDMLIVVTFAGSGGPTLWQNIDDAGIANSTDIITLLPQRDTLAALGSLAEELRYFAIYDQSVPGDANAAFVEKFRELSGSDPDIYAGDSAVAGMLMVDAIRKAGSTENEAIIQALSGFTGESIKGAFEVRAEDHTFLQSFYEATVGPGLETSITRTFTLEESVIPVTQPLG